MARKQIRIIAGPNGAGKTTFARRFLPDEAGIVHFVNADLIAQGLSPFDPASAALRAGRIMIAEIRAHARSERSFAFETTLSGLVYARLIPEWRALGYRVHLDFLRLEAVGTVEDQPVYPSPMLENPELAIARVAARVAQGGHDVPEEVIRRRFASGWRNFTSVYRMLADDWVLYDNSGMQPERIEAEVNK